MADTSLSVRYGYNRAAQDTAELEDWIARKVAQPEPTGQTPAPAAATEPLGPPRPKPSAMSVPAAAAGAVKDTFVAGVKHVVGGAFDILFPEHGSPAGQAADPSGRAQLAEQASGAGRVLLGALHLFPPTLLAMGTGAAVKQFMEQYTPGAAEAPTISGTPAGVLKTMLMVPSLLSPEMRKAIQEHPELVAQELNAPIKGGDLAELLAQFVAGSGVIGKGMKRLGRNAEATAQVKAAEGEIAKMQAAAPAAEAAAQPAAPASAAAAAPSIPTNMADLQARLGIPGGKVPQAEAPAPRAETVRTLDDVKADLVKQAEAWAKSHQPEGPPSPTPEQAREASRTAYSTPLDQPPRMTPDPAPPGAAIPTGDLRTAGEIAMAKTPEAPPANPVPSSLDVAMQRAEEAIRGETGGVDPALLARMAIGAVAGAVPGDTPEEKIAGALVGIGLGALAGPLARKLAAAIKGSGAVNEAGALDTTAKPSRQGYPAVQASEQPFQPNYARVEATPEVAALMKNVHRMLQEDILARRGGVKSHDATTMAAQDRIASGKMSPERVLTLTDEEVLSREDITAARMVAMAGWEHASALRDSLLKGEAVAEGSLKQAVALAGAMGRNVRVAQTRIAQAQEASRIKVGQEGVHYRPEDVAHLADEIAPGMTDAQLATLMAPMKTAAEVGRFATFLSVMPRAAAEALYFSYLSGKAMTRNAIGNLLMMPLAVSERAIGRFMPFGGERAIMPGEGTQMLYAWGEGLIDHVRMIRNLDAIDAEAGRLGFDTLASKREGRYAPAITAENFRLDPGSALGTLTDWAGKVFRFPTEVLNRTDTVSKAINGRMQLRVEAMRQAALEGRSGPDYWTRVGELTEDVTQLSQSARQRVVDFGEQQTFTKDFQSSFLQKLAAGPENEWLNYAQRATVLPFFRTPVRIVEEGMLRSPGLNFLASQFYRDIKAGGPARQVAEARLVTGAGMMALAGYLESQGIITGNAPRDPKLRAIWDKAGHQERSFWNPVSDKWQSLDGLGPITFLITSGADVSAASRRLPEADVMHLGAAYIMSNINSLDSQQFTQGLSQVMDLIKNPRGDSQIEHALTFVRKQLAGLLIPGMAREVETGVDPARRRPRPSGAYPEGSLQQEFYALRDEIWSRIPGLSSATDEKGHPLVPPDFHPITGEDVLAETWPFIPSVSRTERDIPVKKPDGGTTGIMQELMRLRGAGLDEVPDWIGGKPQANYGMDALAAGQGVRLEPWQRQRWGKLMTQEVRDPQGRTYGEALRDLMQSPLYWAQSDGQKGPDGGKAVLINAYHQSFLMMARQRLLDENKDLALKVRLAGAEKAINKAPTEAQPDIRQRTEEMIRSLTR